MLAATFKFGMQFNSLPYFIHTCISYYMYVQKTDSGNTMPFVATTFLFPTGYTNMVAMNTSEVGPKLVLFNVVSQNFVTEYTSEKVRECLMPLLLCRMLNNITVNAQTLQVYLLLHLIIRNHYRQACEIRNSHTSPAK